VVLSRQFSSWQRQKHDSSPLCLHTSDCNNSSYLTDWPGVQQARYSEALTVMICSHPSLGWTGYHLQRYGAAERQHDGGRRG
jgi:hypothetical protein